MQVVEEGIECGAYKCLGVLSRICVAGLADEKVMIARGKSGGVALWIRAKPSWLLV